MISGMLNRNISFTKLLRAIWYSGMFRLLVILFIIKLYARNSIFKSIVFVASISEPLPNFLYVNLF